MTNWETTSLPTEIGGVDISNLATKKQSCFSNQMESEISQRKGYLLDLLMKNINVRLLQYS